LNALRVICWGPFRRIAPSAFQKKRPFAMVQMRCRFGLEADLGCDATGGAIMGPVPSPKAALKSHSSARPMPHPQTGHLRVAQYVLEAKDESADFAAVNWFSLQHSKLCGTWVSDFTPSNSDCSTGGSGKLSTGYRCQANKRGFSDGCVATKFADFNDQCREIDKQYRQGSLSACGHLCFVSETSIDFGAFKTSA